MPRVDVWDIAPDQSKQPLSCGFKPGLEHDYELGEELGVGGFGRVCVVRERSRRTEYACKSVAKRLEVPNVSVRQQEQHLETLKREIAILRKLRGMLNVVWLADVREDETHVHIVMEWCRGGELIHRIGRRHYSEKTVGVPHICF